MDEKKEIKIDNEIIKKKNEISNVENQIDSVKNRLKGYDDLEQNINNIKKEFNDAIYYLRCSITGERINKLTQQMEEENASSYNRGISIVEDGRLKQKEEISKLYDKKDNLDKELKKMYEDELDKEKNNKNDNQKDDKINDIKDNEIDNEKIIK